MVALIEAQVAAVGEVTLPAASGRAAPAGYCGGVEHEEYRTTAVLVVREVVEEARKAVEEAREAVEVGVGVAVMEEEAQPSGRRRAWQRRSD